MTSDDNNRNDRFLRLLEASVAFIVPVDDVDDDDDVRVAVDVGKHSTAFKRTASTGTASLSVTPIRVTLQSMT